MSFRLKTLLGIAAIEVVLLALLVVSGLHYLKTSNEAELLRSAQVTARLFGTMTADAVVATDLATLDSLVELTLRNEGIVYVRVLDASGRVLSQGGLAAALAAPFTADASVEDAASDGRLDVAAPIVVADQPFGGVEIGLSTSVLNATLTDAFRWMLSIAFTEILLVAVFGFILGTALTRQLARLQEGARRVAAGEFGYCLEVRGKDELADTSRSFNRMSAALADFADEASAARDRAEAGRDRAEAVLQDALNSMPHGIIIVNKDESVAFVNTAFRARYPQIASQLPDDATFTTLAGAILPSIVPPTEVQDLTVRVSRRLARLRDLEQQASWESRHQDGSLLLNSQSRMSGGGVVVVENDITELANAHDRNRDLEQQLAQSEKMRSLGTLAGGTAHEFNNLLVPMIGLTELVMEEMEDDSLEKENLKKVLDAGWRAQHLIKQIMSFSRANDAPDDDNTEPLPTTELNAAVRAAHDLVRATTPSTIELVVTTAEDPILVSIEDTQLHQIVINMVGNAAHAMDGIVGQITISVDITERAKSGQQSARLTMADSGTGMDADTLQRIFEPFFTTKEVGQGTGLGLAVIHGIVEQAGGDIEVDSEPGKGTTFRIMLPIAQESDQTAPTEEALRLAG